MASGSAGWQNLSLDLIPVMELDVAIFEVRIFGLKPSIHFIGSSQGPEASAARPYFPNFRNSTTHLKFGIPFLPIPAELYGPKTDRRSILS